MANKPKKVTEKYLVVDVDNITDYLFASSILDAEEDALDKIDGSSGKILILKITEVRMVSYPEEPDPEICNISLDMLEDEL